MFFLYALFGAMGLGLGSFGNVLLCRIHSGESMGGRSHCTACGAVLRVVDLVPILSYLWLRARCRQCKKYISAQYPLVETGSMLLFLLALFLHPSDPFLAFLTGTALYFLFLACAYDFLWQQLPDSFTILLAIVSLVIVIAFGDMASSILGLLVALVWFGGQWVLSRGTSVGTGDIFLAMAIGFWLGLQDAIVMILGSYMVGALIVVVLFLTKKLQRSQQRIAFAPFMGIATILTLLGVGDLYLRMVLGQ